MAMARWFNMAKQSKGSKALSKVFKKYKAGDLKSSTGDKVASRKQAIAIALSEKSAASKPGRKKKK
jgi:hypothetical protein